MYLRVAILTAPEGEVIKGLWKVYLFRQQSNFKYKLATPFLYISQIPVANTNITGYISRQINDNALPSVSQIRCQYLNLHEQYANPFECSDIPTARHTILVDKSFSFIFLLRLCDFIKLSIRSKNVSYFDNRCVCQIILLMSIF